jgi:hypothetical protein
MEGIINHLQNLIERTFCFKFCFIIISFWQNSALVIDPDHSEYVLNELIGPLNGNWPYADFIPQYQTFYGFLLRPFIYIAASAASNVSLILQSCVT